MPKNNNNSFFEMVYEVTRLIPEGRVTSYGAIASYLGSAKSARMVGWALNKSNNLTPPVPAHRVVNRNGLLTGKHHFNPNKSMIDRLEQEGIVVQKNAIYDFKALFWDPSEHLSLEV